ncbi:hypothetical protein AB0I28_28415 [Phytomonospora sp. NPDC050363]|uniref:hypothetical protein n=1 Tax=Phytomonospora sp. NPDC050363 TaxID=3155642 RepID=UPI0033EBA60F
MKSYIYGTSVLLSLTVGVGLSAFSGTAPAAVGVLPLALLAAGVVPPVGLLFYWYLERGGLYVIGPAVGTLVLCAVVSQGLSGYLLSVRGVEETATVSAYAGAAAKGGGHYVRLTGEDGRELPGSFPVDGRYEVGTPVQIVTDPQGWAIAAPADRLGIGRWYPWVAAGGYLVVLTLYVLLLSRAKKRSPG